VHNHIMANHTIYSLTPEMKVRFCPSSPFIHPPSHPPPHPPHPHPHYPLKHNPHTNT
jgi:hypothetical protein